MKQLFTIILISLSTFAFSQIKGTVGELNSTKAKVNSKSLSSSTTTEGADYETEGIDFYSNFQPLTSFQLEKEEHIGFIYKDANDKPIAISANVNYNKRNLSTTGDKANAFLNAVKDIFLLENGGDDFKVVSEEIDELGMHHVRLKQSFNGIDIFGGEAILHGKAGNFDFLNGKIFNQITIDTKPSITQEESFTIAAQNAGTIYQNEFDHLGIFELESPASELVVYPFNGTYKLAYHHSFYSDLMHRWEYFIDAKNGEVINKYQSICKFHNHESKSDDNTCSHVSHDDTKTSLRSETSTAGILGEEKANAVDLLGITREIDTYSVGSNYFMIDASRDMFAPSASNMPDEPVGAIWTIDAFNTSPEKNDFNFDHVRSSNNTWNDRGSVSAQYNGAKAFLYFKNLHGRNSINGSGGNIIGLVNVADADGQSLGNAFWNGVAMFYGSGDNSFNHLAAGLDVAGHEMTHGVIQNTANLTYQDESGALNESFADVFGVMIDREDWLIGEDVVKTSAFPSGALRSMSNPHNGASTGDFGAGWQPKKYSERYQGSQDNGGVHINSGIPNHAFYLFASDNRLGSSDNERKVKAEKVYYRALTRYLTKSSNFVDCRIAVVKAAGDLYNADVVAAARSAFDAVEVFGEDGGSYQNDVNANPGSDLVLLTWPKYDNQGTPFNDNIYVFDVQSGQYIFNPLTTANPVSKPSVNDLGTKVVFVDEDFAIREITIDWSTSTPSATEQVISVDPDRWVNAITSKDGRLVAALDFNRDNRIWVFDRLSGGVNFYELKNPTYTGDISTGDVLYADAMEFDYSGEYIVYDANNRIGSTSAESIDFFDIGFIKVWEKDNQSFEEPDQIGKIFQGLPEGISIGNPTIAKNSNYILAFDVWIDEDRNGQIDLNDDFSIWGLNIETGDNFQITANNWLGYPSYSRNDDLLIFDELTNESKNLNVIALNDDKITNNGQAQLLETESGFGVWFSNGARQFTSVNDESVELLDAKLVPNPTDGYFQLEITAEKGQNSSLLVYGTDGALLMKKQFHLKAGQNEVPLEVTALNPGIYYATTMVDDKIVTLKLVKQ